MLLRSINPATQECFWEQPETTPAELDAALKEARRAAADWARLTSEKRAEYLTAYRAVLESRKEELARLISDETGKPRWEAATEVGAAIGKIAISIRARSERAGEDIQEMTDGRRSLRHKPHGVLAVFGPYNFPLHLPNGHIVPALLAGNTVVFKPSELTPATGEAMVQCWHEAGLPDGVLRLAQGGREVGKALAGHADIDGLLFTGSAPTGDLLRENFARQPGKILALELGGNNPLIVWDATNAEAAAYYTVLSAYITSGQRCTCARRLIIPAGQEGDRFLEALSEAIAQLRVATPDSTPEPFMGTVISNEAADKLLTAQQKLLDQGARSLHLMQRMEENIPLLSPGLLDCTGLTLADEEDFGPLLKLIRVTSWEEAVTAANDTAYGLSAGLLSDNDALWEDFYHRSRAGLVNRNQPLTGASSAMPFGGPGRSGNYRPSAYYAADYCAWPVASLETDALTLPEKALPGTKG